MKKIDDQADGGCCCCSEETAATCSCKIEDGDGEGCNCGQDYSENGLLKKEIIKLAIGMALFLPAVFLALDFRVELVLYLTAYFIVGGEVLLRALKNIRKGQIFDENFLMCIATVGAFGIGAYPEGVAVMLFYQLGELVQNIAVSHSRKSISGLMDIRPDFANLKEGDEIRKVAPETVATGALIVVRPGERVPLDGIVTEGISTLDTSSITGEALPKEVETGTEIYSGSININGFLTVKVTKIYGESTVAKILDLVENAANRKAPTESFITKFAKYYTPAVVFAATALAILPPLLMNGQHFSVWIYRALIFLVASCPCALLISIPLGFFGGIGGASKNGILLKGGNYLEALNRVDTVVFDKTGTLTKGTFKVTNIEPAGSTGNSVGGSISENELLEYAALAECFSTHPIAVSIRNAYGKELEKNRIESYEELAGYGTKVKADGKEILAGSVKLMKKENILSSEEKEIGTFVHIAVDGNYQGFLVVSDELKDGAAQAIKNLRATGVRRIVMLTGDKKAVGQKIGSEIGLDEVFAELLPQQKVEKLEELKKNKSSKGAVIFVGDGINDAPALMQADVGVAMGGLGSDAAIEAADVVLMTDEPQKLADAIFIAHRTKQIVWQNIIFAFAVKAVVLTLGAGGLATMWEAVFADVGVALIAVANAARVLNVKVK